MSIEKITIEKYTTKITASSGTVYTITLEATDEKDFKEKIVKDCESIIETIK